MNCLSFRLLPRFTAPLALLGAALFSPNSMAVDCNTGGPLTLTLQSEVDAFQSTYSCDNLTDNLTITGDDIDDLSPLGIATTAINIMLVISGNPLLTDLDGLGLVSAQWLEIDNNNTLTSISGLSTLTSVGFLQIQGNQNLTNVTGLSNLTATGGGLFISDNPSLSDLSGLGNVASTGGSLVISNNDALTNLDDLNVTSVNGMTIAYNDALTSISGVSGVTNAGSTPVYIRSNPLLTSVDGLSGLTSVSGLIIDNNPLLTNLDPLSSLTSVGNGTALGIMNNIGLTSVDGLGNVQGVGFEFILSGNTSLSTCSILETLLDQVDDYAAGPGPGASGIPDVGDTVTIADNGPGCSSLEDIVPAPPPSAPPGGGSSSSGGSAAAIPTMSDYALLALALLILAAGVVRLRRIS